MQSGGNEYKDLQSEQPAYGSGITNADTPHDGIANTAEQPADSEGEAEVNFSPISSHVANDM